MIRIVVTGSKGRMGTRVGELISMADDLVLAAGVDIGQPLEDVVGQVDVVVDFTTPEAATCHARTAARHLKPIVIGTTGFTTLQRGAIIEAARSVPVVLSPNMSVGVNLMFELVDIAARTLGQSFQVEISETHHVHKKDRPSGTAVRILDVAARARGDELPQDVAICQEDDEASAKIVVRSRRQGEVGKPAGLYGMDDVLGL
jgi:4-hydroxy-tetrahydrodipicolinate reductase